MGDIVVGDEVHAQGHPHAAGVDRLHQDHEANEAPGLRRSRIIPNRPARLGNARMTAPICSALAHVSCRCDHHAHGGGSRCRGVVWVQIPAKQVSSNAVGPASLGAHSAATMVKRGDYYGPEPRKLASYKPEADATIWRRGTTRWRPLMIFVELRWCERRGDSAGGDRLPDYLLAIDQGTTSTRAILFDAADAGRDRAAGIRRRSIRRPAGSSTIRRRSGPPPSRPRAPWRRPAPRGRRRGDRHHQSARDHDRLGPRDRQADPQRHRLAGPAAPPTPARRCAAGLEPGWSGAHRAAARSLFLGHQDRLAARSRRRRRAARRRAARLRHGRQLPAVAAHRRQGARDRRHQRGAHAAARHPHGQLGRELLRAVRRPPLALLPEVRDCAGDFGTTDPRCSAGRSASWAWPATSRRRPWGRAASRPA